MIHPKIKITKNFFEKSAWANNLYVCGLDEVGRGCLAGPLVVGAVILPLNTTYRNLKDSKVMDEAEREQAFAWITKHCWWSIAIINHRTIDAINIYQATLRGMRKAYQQLCTQLPFSLEKLTYVTIDAMPLRCNDLPGHEKIEFHHFFYGERFSTSIAAASIVAKVTRDRLMKDISPLFPAFNFHEHKGYATPQHIKTLLAEGKTIIHRDSFISGITNQDVNVERVLQQSLF